jgi:hypothetical protein
LSTDVEHAPDPVRKLGGTFQEVRQPAAIAMVLAVAALTGPDVPAARGQPERVVVDEVITAEYLTWPDGVALTLPAVPLWRMLYSVLLRCVVSNVLEDATRSAYKHGCRRHSAAQRRCNARRGGRWTGLQRDAGRPTSAQDWPPWPGMCRPRRKDGMQLRHARQCTRQPPASLNQKSARRSGADATCSL